MEVKGKVIAVLEKKTGNSTTGEWTSQDFVIETSGQYPKKVCLNCFKKPVPEIGKIVNVHFEPESREYNGKWFTTLQVWKFEVLGEQATQTQAEPISKTTEAPTTTSEDGDGLPF